MSIVHLLPWYFNIVKISKIYYIQSTELCLSQAETREKSFDASLQHQ